ncbi:biotin--[acetyl-CoA-carboxylase] ligase [Acetobacterium bakii]|uniref:biotin--[acetyl-CoA-carboxylase] ligase n=1 Tax=Acetobacterium bakii TaxID=52689 RepID=UPI0006833185|nr:biotin--[acetyl-CoA-carboxylase] ligase [Acetobacterium bakii]
MDDYNEKFIQKIINTKWLGKKVIYEDVIDSTNEAVKKALNSAQEGLLVVADSQTEGKGSRGRSWISPPGTGVWMSCLLKPEIDAYKVCELTLLISFCIVKVLHQVFAIDARLKWPNDVILKGKKIAGILTEICCDSENNQCLITGIGINVNQENFPDELNQSASSILIESGRRISRAKLIAGILKCVEREYEQYLISNSLIFMVDEYNELLIHQNKEVRLIIGNKETIVISKGINEYGKLEVEYENGQNDFIAMGELSIRGLSAYI